MEDPNAGKALEEKSTTSDVATVVLGGLSREVVKDQIIDQRYNFRKCYEGLLERNVNAYGRIVVAFTIADRGDVSQSQIKESSIADEETHTCVLKVVNSLRFPKDPLPTTVSYPFVFQQR